MIQDQPITVVGDFSTGDSTVLAIEAIYEAAANPSRWPHALGLVAQTMRSTGALLIWQRDDGHFGTVASYGLQQAQAEYIDDGWLERDIRAIRSIERGYFFSGEPFNDLDVCSQDEIDADPFYQNFLARHGLGLFGAVAVSPDRHTAVALSVQRSPLVSQPFDRQELAVIAKLGRYIEQSLRLSIRLMEAEVVRDGFAAALARIGLAVFVLDEGGRVIISNGAADSLLENGVAVREGKLHATSKESRIGFSNYLLAAVQTGAGGTIPISNPYFVHREHDQRPLVVNAISLKDGANLDQRIVQRAKLLITITDPSNEGPMDPSIVRDYLDLTLGEAKVAALIGSGTTIRQTSDTLGIAEETVRTQLKSVFNKSGVNRQPELVALLSRLSPH